MVAVPPTLMRPTGLGVGLDLVDAAVLHEAAVDVERADRVARATTPPLATTTPTVPLPFSMPPLVKDHAAGQAAVYRERAAVPVVPPV